MPKVAKGYTAKTKKKNVRKLKKSGVPRKVAVAIANRVAKKAKKTARK